MSSMTDMRIAAVAIAAVLVVNCSGLVVKKDDTTGETTAKVTTRVVLGISTLGLSELVMARYAQDYDFQQ